LRIKLEARTVLEGNRERGMETDHAGVARAVRFERNPRPSMTLPID
jgi:hypothetical protein